uniref:Uncharacterized protein n=1 Tax=Daphnia galeata TaxID=27404 RepID=A0A8J2VY95_9CRUS|nr:unnamed protein product [Daphnia galeata]
MNFFFLLSLIFAATMAVPFYPEMSATSFRNDRVSRIETPGPLEVPSSVLPRQQLPSFISGLLFFKYIKFIVTTTCINPSNYQICLILAISAFYASLQLINILINCAIFPSANCPCSNFPTSCRISSNSDDTPVSFHFNDTYVQNILAATEMVMSNPSAQNVDALLNLIIDFATANNTLSVRELSAVEQKQHLMLPVSKAVLPFFSAKSQTTAQANIELKTDSTDSTPNPLYMLFSHHKIVPFFYHFQWPVYPEVPHNPPSYRYIPSDSNRDFINYARSVNCSNCIAIDNAQAMLCAVSFI